MIGASRNSLAFVQESMRSRSSQGDLSALSAELLAAADILANEKSLRQNLADSGQPVAARTSLIKDVFGTKVSASTQEVLGELVAARWSSDNDLVDAVELLGSQAAFVAADKAGSLDRVENELFHFARAVQASSELQMTLTDPALSAQAKSAIVGDLLGSKVDVITLDLVKHVAGHLRGRRVDSVLETLGNLAAAQRNQVVAEVRSAIALNADQTRKLSAALSKLTGKDIRINVAIDPSVLGGITVTIGEDVIDGSVAARLESARRTLLA
jgi:F-type H+-transporting ATPase subunit delta